MYPCPDVGMDLREMADVFLDSSELLASVLALSAKVRSCNFCDGNLHRALQFLTSFSDLGNIWRLQSIFMYEL